MGLTPQQFVEKWANTELSERASYQAHFMDVCQLVDYETPGGTGKNSDDEEYAFEYGIKKLSGSQGFADVFLQKHFAVEYKAPQKYRDLRAAYDQLLQYREQLQNPPLLVVTDIQNWEIHTNWSNTEKKVYSFTHEEIATRPTVLNILRNLFHDPAKLHPRRNTEQVTADAATVFQLIADNMRDWQAEPERIAHFLTKLVFCLFAEDVSLLPSGPKGEAGIFSEIVERTRTDSTRFMRYLEDLFQAMADGGDVLLQKIPYFNGSLFVDVRVEELQLEALSALERASRLNWESIEPAIFGTLFERSLDPAKRSQLGAHYTSREDILLIVEPVLMRPFEREWQRIQTEAAPIRARYDEALTSSNRRNQTTYASQLSDLRETMLKQLREVKVLDPACGSGNFLYVALQRLMDMEKAVIKSPLFSGLTEPMPEVHPRQMYGIEKDPIAHALASIVVWIGYLQWRRSNGYTAFKEPILEDLHENIVCKDAILEYAPLPENRVSTENTTPLPENRGGAGGGELSIPSLNPSPLRKEGLENVGKKLARTRTTAEIWERLKPFARDMRKDPTPAEDKLWQRLRKKQLNGFKFRRQHPIGNFIADFFCAEAKLVVEVDGSIHEQQQEYDELRQEYIESLGLRVLRFTNGDVLQQIEGVLERIGDELLSPPPNPLPASQRGGADGDETASQTADESLPLQAQRSGGRFRGGIEPDWQTVDVIIGNPPFLGGSRILGELGEQYQRDMWAVYKDRVPGFADLVCYWFERARTQVEQGKAKRVGLLATNSIRGGVNREVLNRIKATGDIFMAYADRPWVLEGAAVRVSMVGFDDGSEQEKTLDGQPVGNINPDLTGQADITKSKNLLENQRICFKGDEKGGAFDIDEVTAKEFIAFDNRNGCSNKAVIKKWQNASDIVRRSRNMWIIDFGVDMPLEEAELYEKPMEYIRANVKPQRDTNNRQSYRERWWIHIEARPGMREALKKINRYIATPRVSKHRIFVWVDTEVVSDSGINVVARDDDYFFGVLHSKLHEVWSLRMGTWLGKGNDPRYTPTTTFETFPFPFVPGQEDTASAAYQAISTAAKQLHQERHAWLHGIESPSLQVQRSGEGFRVGKNLQDRTLTNLYNALNVFRRKETIRTKQAAADFAPRLSELHDALDKAVCDAYGFPHSILDDEEEILRCLLALNLQRAQS